MRGKGTLAAVGLLLVGATAAEAQDACKTVTMSDVGWTDITTTTAAARQVLEALGYKVDVKVLSVPVTFEALSKGDVDVFLGNWLPAQQGAIQPYLDNGTVDTVATNLSGTKYTLAVPTYAYDAGLKTYDDIAKFAKDLGDKIYGIEPGNEGNGFLVSLTKENKHGLKDFEVVESSEQGMLAMVDRAYKAEKPVVFLGWEPHPMNAKYSLKYLTGGEEFFGGEGVVNTVSRKGYAAECPNLGKFFGQLKFTLPMENKIMGEILDEGEDAGDATLAWMKENPDAVKAWVAGVTTADGEPGEAAVTSELGL
jgi:glycine betaine/proline transport system substrate-binding protein